MYKSTTNMYTSLYHGMVLLGLHASYEFNCTVKPVHNDPCE